ncbi:MAG: hypothetical protein R2717_07930 [Schumannella sp.]
MRTHDEVDPMSTAVSTATAFDARSARRDLDLASVVPQHMAGITNTAFQRLYLKYGEGSGLRDDHGRA